MISVRVFEALGLDTTPLVQAREEYKRIQEQKRREQKEKEAEERKVQEEQHQRLLNEQKQNSWTGNGSREKCSLKSPEGTVLTSISEPKGHSTGM